MADITQRFSIDVSGAVNALNQLDRELADFGNTVDNLGKRLSGFNKSARDALNLGNAGKGAATAANDAKKAFDALFTSSTKAGQAGKQITSGTSAASRALAALGRAASGAQGAVASFGKIGNTAFKTLFGSVSQLGRILGTRILIQAFGALQQAITGSLGDFREFSQRVREVGTILPPVQRNAEALADGVRRLSDNFNLPINAVTEGLYQAVSNQIGDAAESLQFLESVAKFTKVAVTDIDTSVNLLSGTLNAFGLSAGDADSVASQLFKTIELGRTRASELANSLGRILPVASELGISLEEVLAGFSTITIAGIKTSEATTQLRGALNALLKPTEATKELLAELGFTSGEAFVQANGLAGAFQILKDAAGGSITELSKFIPRVRGLNAALILAGTGADKFQQDLQRIREAAQRDLQPEFEFVFETNAEQVAKRFNELKNVLTVDLGGALTEVVVKFTDLLGGTETLTAAIKTFVPIIAAAVAVLGTVGTVALVASKAMTALGGIATATGVAFSTLAIGVTAILAPLAAFAAFKFSTAKIIGEVNALNAAEKAASDERIATLKKEDAARIALATARSRELNAILQKEIAEFNKGFQARVAAAKKANDEIIADQERVVKAVVAAGEAIVNQTQKRIDSENKIQETARNNARDAAQELSDFEFNARNKNFSQLQQFSNLQERANQQRREAADLARRATGEDATEQDIERARAAIERAQATAQEAAAIAQQTGNRAAIFQIENTTRDILQQKLRTEQAITRASEQREAVEKARLARQQEELKLIKERAQALLDAPSLFDDEGQALTGDAQAQALQDRAEAIKNFKQAVAQAETLDASEIINFGSFAREFEQQFSAADIRNLSVNSAAFTDLRSQINDNLADFQAEFGAIIDTLEIAQGITISNPQELSAALTAQIKIEQQALQIDAAAGQSVAALSEQFTLLQNNIKTTEDSAKTFTDFIGNTFAEAASQLSGNPEAAAGLRGLFRQLNTDAKAVQAEFERTGTVSGDLETRIKEIVRQAQILSQVDNFGFEQEANGAQQLLGPLQQILSLAQQLREAQSTGATDNVAEQVQRNAQATQAQEAAAGAAADAARQEFIERQKTSQETDKAATGTNQSASATQQAAGAANQLAAAYGQAAANAERLRDAVNSTGGGGAATARIGRFFPRFLAGGGFAARGTDTIPAMLSPGEFVVNARSTKKFFSQLQAINAGRQPVYRQDGGPVTNVGDINVTVGAGKEAAGTGRQIARSIRRELRRGTSSL